MTTLQITGQPESAEVISGTKVSFTVVAVGEGELTYTWQYKKPSMDDFATTGASKTDTLTVTAGTANNGNQYRVIVSDGTNSVTSDPATLTLMQGGTYDGVTYMLVDGAMTVVSYEGTASSLTILSEVAGYPVTAIGPDAFFDNKSLESISLPNSITVIGARAFKNCSNLSTMTNYD